MLEGIRDRLGGDIPDEIRQQYEAAHRGLTSAMDAARGSDGRRPQDPLRAERGKN